MGPLPLATNDISAKACLTETIQLVPDEKQHCFSNVAPKSMSYSYVVHQYHFYFYVIYEHSTQLFSGLLLRMGVCSVCCLGLFVKSIVGIMAIIFHIRCKPLVQFFQSQLKKTVDYILYCFKKRRVNSTRNCIAFQTNQTSADSAFQLLNFL